MDSLFASCQFCEQIATASRDILSSDRGESIVRTYQLCSWHDSFYGWMYTTLGESVKTRMQIHEMKEGKS